ncbi:U-box domain-containing protein 32 isoform X2 [Humulus lupulus]|uniref:U-box domain-containing protein 32 isoform X2 n=1 Tax=Humulus lupulus TaxID=3486 RepID=UPI002B4072E4|nr:U-box domain-containing protein 32 isoform X2 [Humulus lupulus]
MGSVVVAEEERVFDVEETIFVAVGKRVQQSERALLWALHNFSGMKICLLHVHTPSRLFSTKGSTPANKLKQYMVKACQHLERKNLRVLLDNYLLILSRGGVKAYEVWIEADNIEKGIIEIIARHDVRWLIMGAAADEYYNETLADLKSKKAVFVSQQAASSCHIWFICKGHLIYTRVHSQERSEKENVFPLHLMNFPTETNQSQEIILASPHQLSNLDFWEDTNKLDEISDRLFSHCTVDSSLSSNEVVDNSTLTLLLGDEVREEQKVEEQADKESCYSLEQAIEDTKESKWKDFEEAVKRWKDDEDIVEAKCKAKAFQKLYIKEISLIKESEEMLAGVKQELERMKDERDEFMKELRMVQKENLVLESQLAKSEDEIKELEEKIISAVELLISFREKRDKLRVEHGSAVREVAWLRRLMKGETSSLCKPQLPIFSFLEINEATSDFDPSWKISEGKYGTVYKGILRQMHVAIKMLPSYGSKSQSDFQHEVEIISRVRHPNVETLIGMCPESRSIVYEYLKNGSLEDCLSRKDKTIPWQIRTCIATELCSALIFLHSNKPSIIHGNVKPSNILLDANYVSKLGDLGVGFLIQKNEDLANSTKVSNKPDDGSVYMDPEYLETGELRPESDVYSFGVLLLQLLSARPPDGLVKDVQCALDNNNISAVLDISAGDWPLEQAKQLAQLALRCCQRNWQDRPDLVSVGWGVLEPMRTSCLASASSLVSKKRQRIPSHFTCPILQEIMEDPQIAADGFTYEEEAIRGWLHSGHDTSPMTNLKLEHLNLVPNYALQNAIQEWQLQQ